jgi:hypothetical protein
MLLGEVFGTSLLRSLKVNLVKVGFVLCGPRWCVLSHPILGRFVWVAFLFWVVF